jgi:hypothetical protein
VEWSPHQQQPPPLLQPPLQLQQHPSASFLCVCRLGGWGLVVRGGNARACILCFASGVDSLPQSRSLSGPKSAMRWRRDAMHAYSVPPKPTPTIQNSSSSTEIYTMSNKQQQDAQRMALQGAVKGAFFVCWCVCQAESSDPIRAASICTKNVHVRIDGRMEGGGRSSSS